MKFDWKNTAALLEKILNQGIEQEKIKKSKNPWAYVWNCLRLGACNVMLEKEGLITCNAKSYNYIDLAKKYFQQCASSKANDLWSEMIVKQAKKFLNNGGQFAMFELIYLTGHLEKILNYTTDEHREEVMQVLEKLANKANGAHIKVSSQTEDRSLKGWFSRLIDKDFNDPKMDNRVAYLALKAVILRNLRRNEEAMACITVRITT
jgi:hypothetical protein